MNPVVFSEKGQKYLKACWVMAIVWEGATQAGDTVAVDKLNGGLLWPGRSDSTQTYIGITFPKPIRCESGLECGQISSGRVSIYLAE